MEKQLFVPEADIPVTRRYFVKGAGLVAGGFALGSVALVQACTNATTTTTETTPPPTTQPPPTTTPPVEEPDVFLFFNDIEAETVKAAFGRLIPGSADDPGAIEAGAHVYLDRALSGAYADLQQSYKRGLGAMNAYAQNKSGGNFADLTAGQQDSILSDMQDGTATGFYAPGAPEFFGMLLRHVGEGLFCDPVYGGNRDLIGWKMIGFPGAQHSYGESDMVIGVDQGTKAILTLSELQGSPSPLPDSGF